MVGQWKGAKYGEKQLRMEHDWLKVHAMTGVKTNVVGRRSAMPNATARASACCWMRPPRTSMSRRVLGDKAYSSYANMDLSAEKAVTPVHHVRGDNAISGNTGCETWDKLFHFLHFHRQEFMRAYHKRSNVEHLQRSSVFGDFVRSRNKAAINELLLKIICHNLRQVIFVRAGITAPTFLCGFRSCTIRARQVGIVVQNPLRGFARQSSRNRRGPEAGCYAVRLLAVREKNSVPRS
ncbi:MAG: transposase [Candidatus Binatia bacterium]